MLVLTDETFRFMFFIPNTPSSFLLSVITLSHQNEDVNLISHLFIMLLLLYSSKYHKRAVFIVLLNFSKTFLFLLLNLFFILKMGFPPKFSFF